MYTKISEDGIEQTPGHGPTHEKDGADEINVTGLTGAGGVPTNRGTLSAIDWDQSTLTANGAWQDLDLSAIIPVGTTWVLLQMAVKAGGAGYEFKVRRPDGGDYNISMIRTQAANVDIDFTTWIGCDANRKIQYLLTSGITTCHLDVIGWI